MAYLHENKVEFSIALNLASERFGILPIVAEKDYYVTMILRCLSERLGYIVFKGGTSLSKCHKVIKRFSEDIDITIDTKLSQGQMKKLKEVIQDISAELGMIIPNIEDTRSRRSYNKYILEYQSVVSEPDEAVQSAVLLETSFAEVSFPTVILPVHSYIGDMMTDEAPDELSNYRLDVFDMKVQGLDRTLADKVFAICDYYLQGKTTGHSRHLYDIYKLLPLVPQNEDFKNLVVEVRKVRALSPVCASALPDVNVSELIKKIISEAVYRSDYETVTEKLLEENLKYNDVITALETIAESNIF